MSEFLGAEVELLKMYWISPDLIDREDNPLITDEGKAVYNAITDLYEAGARINIRNVYREVKEHYRKVDIETIKDIEAAEVDLADFNYLRTRIQHRSIRDYVADELLEGFYAKLKKSKQLNTEELRNDLSVIDEALSAADEGTSLHTASDQVLKLQDALKEREQGNQHYSTGDKWMDEMLTYGFEPGSQTTIFSASGLGKTALKLNLVNNRINLHLPTLSIELEMEEIPLAERLVSIRKKIPYRLFHPHLSNNEEIPPNVFKAVEEQTENLKKAKYFYSYNFASLSIAGLREKIRETKRLMGVSYLTVFIDLTTMLEDFKESGGASTADTYQKSVDRLHVLAREENAHIVNIVQANRDIVSTKLKKPEDVYEIVPEPRHVKNSAAFEERSRALIGLNRPKFYLEQKFPDSPENEVEENVMELWFLKQNGGPLGTLKYLYLPETYRLIKYVEEE